jgi:HEAT repeat protein
VTAVLFLLLLADADALLASRDVESRLAGIEQIVEEGHPEAEALLQTALKDRDWEVLHRAVDALAVRGTGKSASLLLGVAIKGPTRKIRLAAALALNRIDPQAAALSLAKKLKGETVIRAAEALEVLAEPSAGQALEKVVKKPDSVARVHALLALGALGDEQRIPFLARYLKDEDIQVRAAAAEALARVGRSRAIGPLREGLSDERMTAVMERRHIAAIRTLFLAEPDAEKRALAARMLVSSLGMGGKPKVEAAYARLLGWLGWKDKPAGPVDDYARKLQSVGLTHADAKVRSAAVAALSRMGRAADRLTDVARSDANKRVRFHALRAAVKLKGVDALELLLDRLKNDRDVSVREEAAFLCGRRRFKEAVPALAHALNDPAWEVCLSAAVSLGKLRAPEGVQPLQRLLKAKDWRRRGAGVVGLGWIQQPVAVDALIGMLRDKEVAVAATALEFLRHMSGQALEAKQKSWREWWSKSRKTFTFRDPGKESREAKKYGYAVTRRGVYEDLDIVVLQTRKGGDNIQFLLKDYGIEHRIIRAASVKKVGPVRALRCQLPRRDHEFRRGAAAVVRARRRLPLRLLLGVDAHGPGRVPRCGAEAAHARADRRHGQGGEVPVQQPADRGRVRRRDNAALRADGIARDRRHRPGAVRGADRQPRVRDAVGGRKPRRMVHDRPRAGPRQRQPLRPAGHVATAAARREGADGLCRRPPRLRLQGAPQAARRGRLRQTAAGGQAHTRPVDLPVHHHLRAPEAIGG